MAIIDNIPGLNSAWKTIIATPTREFDKGSNHLVDKAGNAIIGFVNNFSPSLAHELVEQWDSDMGADRKKAVMEAMDLIRSNSASIVDNQAKMDRLTSIIQGIDETSARATNRYKTKAAIQKDIDTLRKNITKDSAIANAINNTIGDINEMSPLTAQEMQRRTKSVQDTIKRYEEVNK